MVMAPSRQKSKTSASSKADTASKTTRGNHAVFFSPLPPTPPRKNKRPRIESDSEPEEEEPPAKQKKSCEKKTSRRHRGDNADRDAGAPGDLDRQQRKSGAPNRNPLPSPRPSSLSPPPATSSSRRRPSPRSSSGTPSVSDQRRSNRRNAAQGGSGKRDTTHSQSHISSGRSTSNTAALQPVPSNPGRLFADQLKNMVDLDSQDEDPDDLDLDLDLDLEEDIPETKKRKGRKTVADKELEEEEDDNDDGGNHYDLRGNNDDDEEVSAEAVDALMAIINSREKQKYSLTKKQSDPQQLPGHFKKWGRNAHRLLGAYTNLYQTITTGMMVLKARPSTAQEYAQAYGLIPNMSAAAARFYTKKFMYLCKVVPKLKALCGHLLYRSADMFVFAKFFKKHAGAGRSSDLSTLRRNFASYLPHITLSDNRIIRPLTQVEYRKRDRNCGHFSLCTSRLLLPIHERDAFDQNPVEYNKVFANELSSCTQNSRRSKGARMTNDDESYPGFLFPSHFDYDEQAPHRGLLKNTLCESVVRHLYKGPSSVGLSNGAPNLGRTCLADIYDITKLTPDYLVYAATLVRHLLGNDERWGGDDKRRSGYCLHTSLHRLLTLDYEMWEEDVKSGELFDDDDEAHWTTENVFSYYNRLLFGAEEGDPEQQVMELFDYDENIDGDGCDNVRARALNARRAELEAIRLRRRNVEPSHTPSESRPQSRAPSQLRAQSLDYAAPPADRAGANNKSDDEADSAHATDDAGALAV